MRQSRSVDRVSPLPCKPNRLSFPQESESFPRKKSKMRNFFSKKRHNEERMLRKEVLWDAFPKKEKKFFLRKSTRFNKRRKDVEISSKKMSNEEIIRRKAVQWVSWRKKFPRKENRGRISSENGKNLKVNVPKRKK